MTPAVPLAAATACVVRDGLSGIEVLLAQRSFDAPFVPGAYVFPGGKVDPEDRQASDPFKAAVVRETFEEVGILLVAQGSAERNLPLFDQRAFEDFDLDAIEYVSTWVTPEWMGSRFDTNFYLVAAPEDAVAEVDGHELIDAVWCSPGTALDSAARGDMFIISPTVAHLRFLGHYDSVKAAFEGARAGEHSAVVDQEIQEGHRPTGL